MKTHWRLRIGVGLLLLTVVSLGCNPLAVPFHMIYGYDDKRPAECPLHRKNEDEPAKVAILVSSTNNVPLEMIGIERAFGGMVEHRLRTADTSKRSKLTLTPISKVEKFKNENPDWRTMAASDIAKALEVDYLIDLEITKIAMNTNSKQFISAKAEISVRCYDAEGTEGDAVYTDKYLREYPKGRYIETSETTPEKFRSDMLKAMATEIAWKFVPHLSSDQVQVD